MLFAGFDVFQGNLTLAGVIIAGVIGDMAGASIAYSIGYFGRRELLEQQGGKLHVSPRTARTGPTAGSSATGAPVIFVSRMLPVVRAAFPYAAGVAEDAILALLRAGHARLDRLDRRAWRCSGARSAATGRPGATTSSTSTTRGGGARGRDRLLHRSAPL